DSIPAGDKIRTLAKWLKTSPLWLHYGEGESSSTVLKLEESRGTYDDEAVATLPEDYERLTPRHKIMVCEMVQALLLTQKR
ncbi:MAG TPA: hypothetical protein VKO66_04295, partial [Sideroxyarcus sp.]|nr:hypothetical protein [Sideroxyarcus sp.]